MVVYNSTRGAESNVSASYAIVKGLAKDGGLFVPDQIPALDLELSAYLNMTYQEVAYEVLKLYLTDFSKEELMYCINHAYDEKFDVATIAPVVTKGDASFLELFHGSTIAFKDMALSILPYLMKVASKKMNMTEDIVILTATSGDTGKAALAGFAGVEGIKIIVFYPKDGVSPIQEKQMLTQEGDNTHVVSIVGNFDDAQTGVKEIFGDHGFKKQLADHGYQFSSANSINIGRLIPQVVYYIYGYMRMVEQGEIKLGDKINVSVPTGNFGNILAAYFAKEMGLPIDRLICASNDNKVLFDFLSTGIYDRKRAFILTNSPSMDILISSNLERLIYMIANKDADHTKSLMEGLAKDGQYTITEAMQDSLKSFYGQYADMKTTNSTIKNLFNETGYLMDTHTAVGYAVYKKFLEETKDDKKVLIASTASPYKFTKSVMEALDEQNSLKADFDLIEDMHLLSGVPIPNAIHDILYAKIKHNTTCDTHEMKKVVQQFLGI